MTEWRVAVWAAVSSQVQAAPDKESLPEQEAAGRRFAESIGGQVVAVYSVPGHSRDYVFWHEAEREVPAYRQVREDLEAGRLDVIHATDADRLGRDAALVQQFHSLATRHGCEVYLASAPHPVGQQSSGHRYLSAIMSVRAGEDNALRTRRQRMGMKARVQRGMIANHPPTGYDAIRDATSGQVTGYAFNGDIEAVRTMTALYLRGYSISEIVRRLNDAGIPSSTGRAWGHGTIYGILHNDTYAGLPDWGPFQADKPSGTIPVLWDAATYAAVVEQRRKRRTPYHSPFRRNSGPLSGVAFCNRCGSPMTRYRYSNKKYGHNVYLTCSRHRKRSKTGISCHHNNISERRVLSEVGRFLESLVTPEAIRLALEQLGDDPARANGQVELDAMHTRIADLQRQRERLALALAAGQMDAPIYRTTDDKLVVKLEAEQDRAATLAQELESMPDPESRAAALEELAGGFDSMLAELEPVEVAGLLQAAGVRVWIEDNQVVRVTLG